MGVSRVQKFKDYRNSLIKDETPDLKTPKSSSVQIEEEKKESTSTLPLDEVISNLQIEDDEEMIKKRKRLKIIKFSLIGLGIALVIAGIIIFAILVF